MRLKLKYFTVTGLLAACIPAATASGSETNSILEHCDFEQPEVRDHYFPTFLNDSDTAGQRLPLIDLLIGPDGIPIQQVHIGELPPGADGEVLSLISRYMKFTPAIACGEPVEGFYRFALNGYFWVVDGPEELTVPPYARFTLPEELFNSLRTANYVTEENQLKFILEISEEGKVVEIEGTSEWTSYLASGFMADFMGARSFTPARLGEKAVPVKLAMGFSLIPPDLDQAVLDIVQFKDARKPMPVKPENIDYPEPKVFTVGGTVTDKGLIGSIQILDPIEKEERISVINALRNWYLPREDPHDSNQVVMLELSFTPDSQRAVLIEETYREQLFMAPRPIKQSAPHYPDPARRHGLQGATQVLFVVGKDGDVLDAVATSSTDPVFVDSAVKAVRKWKFEPGSIDGKPVNTRCRIVIPFKFRRR